jgi:hypothetical protein
VTKVRLSRNKKTAKAKHYAFLEFQYPDVAAVAAQAMDGYMLFKQKLSVHVMPAKVCVAAGLPSVSSCLIPLIPGALALQPDHFEESRKVLVSCSMSRHIPLWF